MPSLKAWLGLSGMDCMSLDEMVGEGRVGLNGLDDSMGGLFAWLHALGTRLREMEVASIGSI